MLVFIISNSINAQSLTIKSVTLQINDNTAIESPCLDNNGDTCALLKIKADKLEGLEFPNTNQYIKSSYSDGIYYVYLPAIIRKLELSHKNYLPIEIDMKNFGYNKLAKGKTYIVVLETPMRSVDLGSSVIIKVEPKHAKIVFDGETYETNPNGIPELPTSVGNHIYEVSAPDYLSQKRTVSICQSEAQTVSVRLYPITHEVLIESNVKSARVFVDNIDYGKVGKLQIPQGQHTIRVQAEGYMDSEKSTTINASTNSLSFKLNENKRTTHIHPTPVIIYSSSNHVYKNNKVIKEWRDGATIMFMPGKYIISDDYGKIKKKIKVEQEPMVVNLDE